VTPEQRAVDNIQLAMYYAKVAHQPDEAHKWLLRAREALDEAILLSFSSLTDLQRVIPHGGRP
jgi:hypothetical protein